MVFGASKLPPRYVVRRIAGPQTGSGPGDILIDNEGGRWREIDSAEASMLRSGTACAPICTLYPNGTIS